MILPRLIRLPNLLVVGLTQWLVARWVLGGAYARAGIDPVLRPEELAWLILATTSLTAAGYVVNDVLDRPIDLINRPERVIVGERITVGTAAWLAAGCFFLGFGASLLLAFRKQELEWLWLYPLFGWLLGIYPRRLKTRPFLGNVFIALCCAGAAGLVWLAERAAWRQLAEVEAKQVAYLLVLFMGYAFLATWIREIVKDLEDIEGDRCYGRVTTPVYLGAAGTKRLVYGLTGLLAALLLSVWMPLGRSGVSVPVSVVSTLLAMAALYLSRQLAQARRVVEYAALSRAWKLFMLGGLLLLYLYQI